MPNEDSMRERSRYGGLGAFVLAGAGLAMVTSCGEPFEAAPSAQPSCADEVGSCASNEVCWVNADPQLFECMTVPADASGPRQSCTLTAGKPQCPHDYFCYVLRSAQDSDRICTPRCDPLADNSDICDSGICTTLDITSAGEISLCQP